MLEMITAFGLFSIMLCLSDILKKLERIATALEREQKSTPSGPPPRIIED